MDAQNLKVKIKDLVKPQELVRQLVGLRYENIGVLTPGEEGEFGKRGNLVDIWLERYKMPVRIDLIDEKVENIYLFNPLTQSVVRRLKEIYIVPFGVTPKIAPTWFKKAKFPSGSGSSERLFLSEVKIGDLIVHIDHGIGKFVGMREKFLVVQYARGDKLSVPIEQIDRLTKYIGAAGHRPRLNVLGTASWEKIKTKVQEGVLIAAKDLLALYAKRELVKRPSYSPDSAWQKQMEETFEYEETPDQLKAAEQIKKDLEGQRPMDRLLVGDVGFGKTEVAMRAAFKVIQDNKQVAVLVPTTLLAEQHYYVFKDRLAEFPVKVEMLSRFRREEEQREILRETKKGEIDILIGTHRLLSSDVDFKNLGLLIIDEEHRFGVNHKEKLKNLRTSVDVLSMSATPIPRTLHMALTKLRDISLLQKPPEGRMSIKTEVWEFDETKINTAIGFELARGGQVYYLHNSVSTISRKAAEIANLVLKSRVVFAHGQMSGYELEKVMNQFYSKEADILVCTTIIGSGIDMPNVNTIIIEDAQNFGLADLHQLRGRVGRSERQAFAFLFYPKSYLPGGDVLERFLALKEASYLGGGYKLAKKDLEIRGAGNLLGKAQSGNIALVGFELYIQLLNQAVEKMKGR